MNGFDIPTHLPSGKTFHYDSHKIYNELVENELKKISTLEGELLLDKMNQLTTKLREELVKAYSNNKGIDEHFITIQNLL